MLYRHRLIVTLVAAFSCSVRANVLFVDDDAPLGGDGQTWGTAYRFLQDALFDAAGDLTINEIRVAQGTYTPDQDEAGNVIPGERAATFNPLSGVSMLGGFAGLGAVDPDVRDIVQYTTVLSGDLSGDDGSPGSFANNAENSRNVVTGDGTDPSAVLDGFTVTGGNADGPNHQDNPDLFHLARGGGIWNATGSPTVRNCRIEYNAVLMRGGGMYNLTGTNPVVIGCTFRGNVVTSGEGHGGGLRNFESNATVTDCVFVGNSSGTGGGMDNTLGTAVVIGCTFLGNSAVLNGGGMANRDTSSLTVTSCMFSGNTASHGGGMANRDTSSLTVTSCTFSGNTAVNFGGGMFNIASNCTVTNCTFSGNTAAYGGGMDNASSSLTVTNCTFTGNTANTQGGGMYIFQSSPTVTNCILWDDSPDEIGDGPGAVTTVLYSDVQFGSLGIGNIDANPLFVGGPSGTWTDPGVFDPVADVTTFTDTNASFAPGGLVGGFLVPLTLFPTERPIVANTATTISVFTDVAFLGVPGFRYEVNDYRLTAASPCIDAADNTAVPTDINTDLDGNPRFVDDPDTPDTGNGDPPIVDMGAYEFQGTSCPWDCESVPEGTVGINDFLDLLAQWGGPGSCDFDGGGVGINDFLELLANWGPCP